MTEVLRTKMVLLATRIMAAELGAREARQRAEDVVHDALAYHLSREPWDEHRFVNAVCWYAKVAARNVVLSVAMPEGAKRARMTHVFPNQVFGCQLADAFKEAA